MYIIIINWKTFRAGNLPIDFIDEAKFNCV